MVIYMVLNVIFIIYTLRYTPEKKSHKMCIRNMHMFIETLYTTKNLEDIQTSTIRIMW